MSKPSWVIRWSTAATVVGLGTVAAVVSFRHALEVVEAHGEDRSTALLYPGTIDGLVFMSSMVLLDAARSGEPAPLLAKWTLGIGIGATVAVNVLHGIEHGPVGAVIAAWPALALVLTVELMMGLIRRGRQVPAEVVEEPEMAVELVAPAVEWAAGVAVETEVADEDLNSLDEDDDPAQRHIDAMIANMKLANAAGVSQERLAELLGTKRHKIAPLIKQPSPVTKPVEPTALTGDGEPVGEPVFRGARDLLEQLGMPINGHDLSEAHP
jgi:hypothetical protein